MPRICSTSSVLSQGGACRKAVWRNDGNDAPLRPAFRSGRGSRPASQGAHPSSRPAGATGDAMPVAGGRLPARRRSAPGRPARRLAGVLRRGLELRTPCSGQRQTSFHKQAERLRRSVPGCAGRAAQRLSEAAGLSLSAGGAGPAGLPQWTPAGLPLSGMRPAELGGARSKP